MNLGIQGKWALVLAASRGIGFAIADALCQEGVNVIITGRDHDRLAAAKNSLCQYGTTVISETLDLSDPTSRLALQKNLASSKHLPDILINNTGSPPFCPAAVEVDRVQWQLAIENMLLSIIEFSNWSIIAMKKKQWGRLLTITSSGVIVPQTGLVLSNSLRAAIVNWNKSIALELAATNITANILVPGRIATERLKEINLKRAKLQNTTLEQLEGLQLANIPSNRYGKPTEVGQTAAFLVSQAASYITGSMIRVDGGMIKAI